MQNDKLLPCPFCGGEAFVDTHRFWDVGAKDFTVKTYGVRCYECQAGTMQYFRTEEDAIKQWNTRNPMERIVEQLEGESDFFGGEPMGSLQKAYYCKGIENAIEIVRNGGKE